MVMIIQPDRLTRGVAHTPLLSHNPLRGRAAKRWNPMQTLAVLNFICPIETRNYIFSHDQMMRPWCVAPGPAAMCKITLYEMHFAALAGGHCGGGVGCSCSDKFAYFERILSAAPGQTHTQKERERYVERDVHSCNPFLGSGWKYYTWMGHLLLHRCQLSTCYYCHFMGVMEGANSKQQHQHRKVPLAQC